MWKEYKAGEPIDRQEPEIKPNLGEVKEQDYDTELAYILDAAGVGPGQDEVTGAPRQTLETRSAEAHRKRELEREHNIKPGSDEWMRLNFARPDLTGETPHDKW